MSNINYKVSVIIPVYNAEVYLKSCIESIQNQTFKDIEIIIVNDGSTDNSLSICLDYAKTDNRIVVINKPNGGVSSARNAGIQVAKGEYIGFVDADDWVKKDAYLDMINLVERYDADIGIFAHYYFDGITSKYIGLPWESGTIFNREEIIKKLIPAYISPIDRNGDKHVMIFGSVWKCIFKKQLILNNDIRFEKKLKYTEDLVFVLHSLIKSCKVAFNNKAYYYYRNDKREATATTQRYVDGAYENLKLSQEMICELLNDSRQLEGLAKSIEARNCLNLLASIYNICANNSPYRLIEKIKIAIKMKKDCDFNKSIDLVGYLPFKLEQRLLFWLIRYRLIFIVITLYQVKNVLRKL